MKLFFNTIKFMCAGVLLSGSLLAEEPSLIETNESNVTETKEHIKIGTRPMTHLQKVAIQEERASLAEQAKKDEQADEKDLSKNAVRAISGMSLTSNLLYDEYYTTHPGAFHQPVAVSPYGDTIELEDGSVWTARSYDRYKTLDWMMGDSILIAPNHNWFSLYDFKLINQNTGAHVEVNLSLGPYYNGFHTRWIQSIDYYNRIIVLDDHSVWNMSKYDRSIIYNWAVNDTVIIGINDGWLVGDYVNILINVNMLNYGAGKSLN